MEPSGCPWRESGKPLSGGALRSEEEERDEPVTGHLVPVGSRRGDFPESGTPHFPSFLFCLPLFGTRSVRPRGESAALKLPRS
jgi:hypothetical protein